MHVADGACHRADTSTLGRSGVLSAEVLGTYQTFCNRLSVYSTGYGFRTPPPRQVGGGCDVQHRNSVGLASRIPTAHLLK
jgi:hypothetical protein